MPEGWRRRSTVTRGVGPRGRRRPGRSRRCRPGRRVSSRAARPVRTGHRSGGSACRRRPPRPRDRPGGDDPTAVDLLVVGSRRLEDHPGQPNAGTSATTSSTSRAGHSSSMRTRSGSSDTHEPDRPAVDLVAGHRAGRQRERVDVRRRSTGCGKGEAVEGDAHHVGTPPGRRVPHRQLDPVSRARAVLPRPARRPSTRSAVSVASSVAVAVRPVIWRWTSSMEHPPIESWAWLTRRARRAARSEGDSSASPSAAPSAANGSAHPTRARSARRSASFSPRRDDHTPGSRLARRPPSSSPANAGRPSGSTSDAGRRAGRLDLAVDCVRPAGGDGRGVGLGVHVVDAVHEHDRGPGDDPGVRHDPGQGVAASPGSAGSPAAVKYPRVST